MSAAADHDAYLAALPDDQRRVLSNLRATIRSVLPDAVECISYAMPAFREAGKAGKVIIGYAAFAKHCGIYPYSGSVIPKLQAKFTGWKTSKSGVLFTPETPIPDDLIREIIDARLAEIPTYAKT